jgi:hypothetical protein
MQALWEVIYLKAPTLTSLMKMLARVRLCVKSLWFRVLLTPDVTQWGMGGFCGRCSRLVILQFYAMLHVHARHQQVLMGRRERIKSGRRGPCFDISWKEFDPLPAELVLPASPPAGYKHFRCPKQR